MNDKVVISLLYA